MFKHVFPDARRPGSILRNVAGSKLKRMDGGVMQERSEAAGQEAQAGHAASVCAARQRVET